MTEFRVAVCQYGFAGVDSVAELWTRASRLLERAGPADLYVLPELFACDVASTPDATAATAALDDGAVATLHERIAAAATERDAVVVGGSYDVRDGGRLVNRCPVGVPGRGVRTYDKRHPTPAEREDGVAAGDAAPPVVEHRGVGVGVVVCYDVEFPGTVRAVVDDGAEVLAVPSWTGSEAGHQRVRRCSMARAVENQAYFAHVPVVDCRDGGESAATGRAGLYAPCDDVVGPGGTRLSLARDEHAAATGRVDVAALRESRERASVRPYTDYRRGRE